MYPTSEIQDLKSNIENPKSAIRNPQSEIPSAPALSPHDHFGRANWLLIGAGIVLLVVGFVVLALADERAANLAGRLSPFLILGAYGLIFAGLILRAPK